MKRITINPTAFNDEPDYFPLYNGLRNSSMGLLKFSKSSSRHFIIGPSFNVFRANKEQCRLDGLSKYYQKTNAYNDNRESLAQQVKALSGSSPRLGLLATAESALPTAVGGKGTIDTFQDGQAKLERTLELLNQGIKTFLPNATPATLKTLTNAQPITAPDGRSIIITD